MIATTTTTITAIPLTTSLLIADWISSMANGSIKSARQTTGAIPLLLINILLSAVNVIGIGILKKSIAKIPKTGFLKANKKQTADTNNESFDILSNPILSPITPPSIFPNTTANIKLLFYSKVILIPYSF